MGIVATLLVPLHHPVDLAERVATMDIITGGRFALSAALGYRDEEYNAFGLPRRRRVSRYLECLEVMRQLWTQDEVTFHGEHFDLDRAQMTLRPIQQPHPPIWVAANGDAAIKRAARRGFTWYVNPHATYTNIKRQTELYHATAEAAGSDAPQDLPIARELYVHESREQALAEVAPSWAASMRPMPSGGRTRQWTKSSARPLPSWPGTGSSSATRRTASERLKSSGIWGCPTAASG